MDLKENWPVKVVFLVVLIFIGGLAYWGYKFGEHMAVKKQIDNVLTEKYRAPTNEAWKHVYDDLGVPYSEDRELTTEEMKRYLAKSWAEGIESARPQK